MQPNDNPNNPLFIVPEAKRSKTSDVIAALIDSSSDKTVTLRALVERLGDRTFGLLFILLSIFNVLPLFSLLGGLLICSLGLQMLLGRQRAWFPNFVLDKPLAADKVQKVLRLFEPKVRFLETYVRPRWQMTEAPIVDRINGAIIALLGVIIALPIPFTNIPPAFIVLVMGLALTERDGLLQIISSTFAVSVVVGLIILAS